MYYAAHNSETGTVTPAYNRTQDLNESSFLDSEPQNVFMMWSQGLIFTFSLHPLHTSG
jgi:hypothetical protein